MRYLTLGEVLGIYRRVMEQSGGMAGIRDLGVLESAVAQPRMAFSGKDLYPTIVEKAAALCFSIIQNHPFADGNKRTGHASMETFLLLNGFEIDAGVSEQVDILLSVASGRTGRSELAIWLEEHVLKIG